MSTLENILKAHGLEHLNANFESQGIEDEMLCNLTDHDLLTIGLKKLGDRKKLLKAFSDAGQRTLYVDQSQGVGPTLLLTGAIGSFGLVKCWQISTRSGAIYIEKDLLQWLVFAGAFAGFVATLAIGWRIGNQNKIQNKIQIGAAVIFSFLAAVSAIPDSFGFGTKSAPSQTIKNGEETRRMEVIRLQKNVEETRRMEAIRTKALETARLKERVSGIYERQFYVLITGKNTTESYDIRLNGDCIYSKDTGLGLGGVPIGGPFGNSNIKGGWSLNDTATGMAVRVDCGPCDSMSIEGDDLVDSRGNRWLRVR